jgi:hypothetical protein
MDFSSCDWLLASRFDAKANQSGAGGSVAPRAMLKINAASPPD